MEKRLSASAYTFCRFSTRVTWGDQTACSEGLGGSEEHEVDVITGSIEFSEAQQVESGMVCNFPQPSARQAMQSGLPFSWMIVVERHDGALRNLYPIITGKAEEDRSYTACRDTQNNRKEALCKITHYITSCSEMK